MRSNIYGLPVLALLFLYGTVTGQQVFTEVAGTLGIDLNKKKDGGFAFGYLNDDDYLDLIINTNSGITDSKMYFSDGPPNYTFTEVTSTHCAGLSQNKLERSLVIADFNNDGYNDFMRNTARRFELYINKGPTPADGDPAFSFGDASQDPNFELYTNSASDNNPANGVPGGMNVEGLGAIDFDHDGDLDIMLENHNWGIDIYENVDFASGTFVHATPDASSLGLPISAGDGDYSSVTDINNDGYIDIVARKRNQEDFFVNRGNGTFRAIGTCNRQASNSNKGAVSLQDFDNDGDFDMMWTERDSNMLYINDNNRNCISSGEPWLSAGLTDPYNSGDNSGIDGLASGDIDNDGDIDLFLCDDSGPSYLFINQLVETGSFGFIRNNLGIDVDEDAEGASFVDYDNDGDLDLYINVNSQKNQLWQNNLESLPAGDSYLAIRIFEDRDSAGVASGHLRRPALGATVELMDCDGNVISGLRDVNGGSGHGTQDPPVTHFGLPHGPDSNYIIVVRYPRYHGTRLYGADNFIPASLGSYEVDISPGTWGAFTNQEPDGGDDYVAIPNVVSTANINAFTNDSDPDGDTITIQSIQNVSDSAIVTITDADNGLIHYQYTGTSPAFEDTFYYVINDDPSCLYAGRFDTVMVIVERSGLLPVVWLEASAAFESPGVAVEWTTASEHNTSYFKVMRSTDAINFEEVARVSAAGSSSTLRHYRVFDAEPPLGEVFYKVIQVDVDENSDSTEMMVVEVFGGLSSAINVYPNPSDGNFAVSFPFTPANKQASLILRNLLGEEVRHVALQTGYTTHKFELEQLESGTYFVEWVSDNQSLSTRLVIR